MSSYTEDLLVEQPALQLMQHELGWDVVNCYDEPSSLTILRRGFERQELRRSGWTGGVSNQGRDGKREGVEILNFECSILNGRGRRQALQRLNSDLPVEMEMLNFECWILNERGRPQTGYRLNLALRPAEANRESKLGVKLTQPLCASSALAILQFPK